MINFNTLKGPMSWSILSLLVITIYGFFAITDSFSPLFRQSNELVADSQSNTLLVQHDAHIAMDIARFKGRSAFFKPVRKAPPPPPPAPKQDVEQIQRTPPPDPGPPPAPSSYMGPDLIAIIGDEAWFRGSGSGSSAVIRLKAGTEKDGLKVVSTSLPSMVTVEYRRGVYEIDLFIVEEPFFLEQAPPPADTSFLKEVDDTRDESSPS